MARLDGQSSDGADGGERLAAEAQRGDIEEVLVAELGGGVSLHGEGQVGCAHALAVVADANEGKPTGDGYHLDLPRAGVERVLHEFLDHTGGALDHLTGGNAVDRLGAQLADGQLVPPSAASQGNEHPATPPSLPLVLTSPSVEPVPRRAWGEGGTLRTVTRAQRRARVQSPWPAPRPVDRRDRRP